MAVECAFEAALPVAGIGQAEISVEHADKARLGQSVDGVLQGGNAQAVGLQSGFFLPQHGAADGKTGLAQLVFVSAVEIEAVQGDNARTQIGFVEFEGAVPLAVGRACGKGSADGIEAEVVVFEDEQGCLGGQVEVLLNAVCAQVDVADLQGVVLRLPV